MGKMVKKKLKINGMHCVSCSLSIDFDLEDLPGIKSAKTNYAKAECEVEFEENQVSLDQILQTIQRTGYQASLI